MKVGIIAEENLNISAERFIPSNVSYILTVDTGNTNKNIQKYAQEHNIPLNIFRPNFEKFGQLATAIRNKHLSVQTDMLIIIWSGKCDIMRETIQYAKNLRKYIKVFLVKQDGEVR